MSAHGSVAAAKVDNKAELQKFGRKHRSQLHNRGNQCYATTVLQYLLANEDFRSKVLLKLESEAPLVAKYLAKLHLYENVSEHYLHQLVGLLDKSFLNSKNHHDADEFLLKLLMKLGADSWTVSDRPMFEVLRVAHVRCATPGCLHEFDNEDEKLGKF